MGRIDGSRIECDATRQSLSSHAVDMVIGAEYLPQQEPPTSVGGQARIRRLDSGMDDAYLAKVQACEKLHERARHFRGRFLNSVAVIEHHIAAILTEYFCIEDEAKRELFFSEIAGGMSLNMKRELLVKVVKRDYPRYWDENGQFLRYLEKIQTLRNKLAHSIVDVSDAALARPVEDGVGFVQWKDGQPITAQEFEDWQVKANMVLSTLSDIKGLLPFKERSLSVIGDDLCPQN